MSTLDSNSTRAEIEAAYDDNASYREDGSAAKAAAFITACRMLLRAYLKASGSSGGSSYERDMNSLREELRAAEQWHATAAAAQTGGGVRHASCENFRG